MCAGKGREGERELVIECTGVQGVDVRESSEMMPELTFQRMTMIKPGEEARKCCLWIELQVQTQRRARKYNSVPMIDT